MMSPQYSLLPIVLAISLIAGVSYALPPKKVVGGESAQMGEFPYVVSLRKQGVHHCGGVIIDERHVLTAAHCIKSLSPPYNTTVVVTGSVDEHSGELHDIKSIMYDDRYDNSTSSPYDIALIALKKNITFNDYQRSVALPDEPHSGRINATVAGWGTIIPFVGVPPGFLLKTNTRILSHEECLDRVEHKDWIHKGYHICASNPFGSGPCDGDSGGPLVYDGHLIGIASFVTYGCALGYPVVYIDVIHFLPWIRENIARTYSSHKQGVSKGLQGPLEWLFSQGISA